VELEFWPLIGCQSRNKAPFTRCQNNEGTKYTYSSCFSVLKSAISA